MKIANLILISALTAAPIANAGIQNPWPGDNPPVPETPAATTNAQPIRLVAPQPQQATQPTSNSGSNQGSQIMQQITNMLNNREVVGGGGSGGSSSNGSGYDSGNSVDNAISYKGNGNCIKVGNSPCTSQKLVEGCAKEDSGKLSFSNSGNGKINNGCEDIRMSEELANALDMNFARCAKQAAGINGTLISPKIHHIGCISSDANHAHTGSLHEDGRAIDVRAIELGGRVYDAQNDADDAFFTKFRKCWGDSANSLAGNCLTGNHPASVGEEDAKHKDHHLHISMPLCPNVAAAQGRKYAWIQLLLLGDFANAQESTRYLPSKPTFKGKTFKLKDGGEAKLVVEDTGGEPVGADTFISVDLKCAGRKSFAKVEKPVEGCAYESSDYDAATDIVTIRYRTSTMVDGMSACTKQETKILKLNCPAAKPK